MTICPAWTCRSSGTDGRRSLDARARGCRLRRRWPRAAGRGLPRCRADLRAEIHRARELTSRPFGVNLFVPTDTTSAAAPEVERYAAPLHPEAERHGLTLPEPDWHDTDHWQDKLALLIADPVAVVSFHFGCPPGGGAAAARGRHAGLSSAPRPDEAVAAQAVGADAVCLQAATAGGHRGTHAVAATPERPRRPVAARRRAPGPLAAGGGGRGLATRQQVRAVLEAGAAGGAGRHGAPAHAGSGHPSGAPRGAGVRRASRHGRHPRLHRAARAGPAQPLPSTASAARRPRRRFPWSASSPPGCAPAPPRPVTCTAWRCTPAPGTARPRSRRGRSSGTCRPDRLDSADHWRRLSGGSDQGRGRRPVKERTSIEDVVREHVTLRPAGGGLAEGAVPLPRREDARRFNVAPAVGATTASAAARAATSSRSCRRSTTSPSPRPSSGWPRKLGIELHYEEGGGRPREAGPRPAHPAGRGPPGGRRSSTPSSCSTPPEARAGARLPARARLRPRRGRAFGVGFAPRAARR